MRSVLVIEDDESLITILKHHFRHEMNIEFTYCTRYQEALDYCEKRSFDIYIIDLNLDGFSGLNLLRILQKEKDIDNRAILFSSETNDDIKIQGYNLGASNFVEKPLNIDLLRAIIKRNLRVLDRREISSLRFGSLEINLDMRTCRYQQRKIYLTQTEFNLLNELMKSPARIVPKDHLSFMGKDPNKAMTYKALEMHLSMIKKKLGNKELIKTVRGIGYVLSSED